MEVIRKYNYILYILLTGLLFTACGNSKKENTQELNNKLLPVSYAQGFTVSRTDTHTEIEVRDPWDSTRILQRYLLVGQGKDIPSGLPPGTLVRTPIKQIVAYSSVTCGALEELNALENVVGVCEAKYIDIPLIKEKIISGKVADLGEATAPNTEKMIDINAEVIIATPFENMNYGAAEKIGIPIIESADYMEPTPLGRAEWIRFYGFFCGKEQQADSIFHETEQRYLKLKELAATAPNRPTVLTEKKFGSVWYVPGGSSYMGQFFKDAGASYIFSGLDKTGSVPYPFETVFDKGAHADFWLIKYNGQYEMSYNDLKQEYTPYANFDAFTKRNIYTCNTAEKTYYEELPTHPDRLLKELVWLFHPELIPDYSPRYYQKMKE